MNKPWTKWALGIGIAIGILWSISSYNTLVNSEESVVAQWQNVETVYQARADKTKNLVEIVKGAAGFEQETLTQVIEARAKSTSIKLEAKDLTPENMAKFSQAQAELSKSLGRLLMVAEQYPQLKAVDAFRDFQAQYEGMENRITTERRKYNDMAKDYNASIRRFPKNIFAGIFGFVKKAYFEAQEGTEKAPDINMKLN